MSHRDLGPASITEVASNIFWLLVITVVALVIFGAGRWIWLVETRLADLERCVDHFICESADPQP